MWHNDLNINENWLSGKAHYKDKKFPELLYFINFKFVNCFQIHPKTGLVSTKHPVEYDGANGIKSFTFNIIVRDRGIPQKSGTASAVVRINDVNDNK